MNIFSNKALRMSGAALAAVLLISGCAEESTTDTTGMAEAFFNSWMSVNHPGVSPTSDGVYIIEDTPGTGETVTDDDFYLFTDYTATDLDGNVVATTSEKVSQRLGSYKKGNYYGAEILINDKNYIPEGLTYVIKGMKVGGKRTAIVPSWLNVTSDDHLEATSGSNTIYTIDLLDKTDKIDDWEIDTLRKYVAINMSGIDSTKFGYYCKTLKEPTVDKVFSSDTTFYINYTGRLLNGQVFDTTIEDTAKVYGLYSSSKTYAPMLVKPSGENSYKEIRISTDDTSEGSTVVDGFAFCLSRLRPYEKVICAFYSTLAYGYSGKDSLIPRFAPLVFEIEVVDGPDEDEVVV